MGECYQTSLSRGSCCEKQREGAGWWALRGQPCRCVSGSGQPCSIKVPCHTPQRKDTCLTPTQTACNWDGTLHLTCAIMSRFSVSSQIRQSHNICLYWLGLPPKPSDPHDDIGVNKSEIGVIESCVPGADRLGSHVGISGEDTSQPPV